MWLPKPTDSRKAVGNSDNQLSYAYPHMYIYVCVGRGRGEEDGSSSGYKFTMFLLAAIFLHYTVLPLIADSRKVMVARHAIERFDFHFYHP